MKKRRFLYLKKENPREYVDGEVDTPYELFMFIVIIVNTIGLGLETSKNISEQFKTVLFYVDQVCLFLFIIELIFKIIVYNKTFFGEKKDNKSIHVNWWNISDLIIVLVSVFSTIPSFSVFRVFRLFRSFKAIKAVKSLTAVKSFKIVNEIKSLRTTFKGFLKAIPGIIATFVFLAIFAYVYAIIGTNIFCEVFPQYFGSLGTSILTLCQVTTFDSWFSEITRPITQVFPWAWVYFISYAFIAASVIMNVIVGIIVDCMGKEREHQKEEELQKQKKNEVTLEKLSEQISELQKQIVILEKHITKKDV